MSKFAKKVDANQNALCKYAKSLGASVQYMHSVGAGFPDVILGYEGVNYLCEIKTEKGKLNALQVEWFKNWKGQAVVVRTESDIKMLLKGEV